MIITQNSLQLTSRQMGKRWQVRILMVLSVYGDTDSGNQLFTFTQHSGSQTALAFNTINTSKQKDVTNNTLTSIGLRDFHIFVSVWDIDTGNRLSIDKIDKDNRFGSEVSISPDGSLFVTNDRVVRLWDTQQKANYLYWEVRKFQDLELKWYFLLMVNALQ